MKSTILFIMHMPPPVHGAAMVGKYIHDSKLVNESFDCHYINLATATSLEDIGKGGVKKLVRFAKLLCTIRKEVKQLRPDLVYVTPNACGGAFYKDFVVVQMLKQMGCRVVVHYHNKGVSTRQDRWLDDKLYRRFFRDLKVILLAEALYADVKKYVHREDVYICPNGIPETLTEEPVAHKNHEVPRLLFLSNLLVSKGVLVLLDACKLLSDKGYSFVCDFVGGETAEMDAVRFAEEVEKRHLKSIVTYHGKKYGAEKELFWQNADIFVFPTYYSNECFPLVLLEAMLHEVACISTPEGGITDIIKEGENGYLVERGNAAMLVERLEELIQDPELCWTMGKCGREMYQDKFTLSKFESRIKNVLAECCSSQNKEKDDKKSL